jgi:ABC-type amino acid transport substrate-binding protein
MLDGEIDVLVSDGPIIWWLAATYEARGLTTLPFFLTEEYIAWGARKTDTQLIDSANRFLEGWKRSGRLKQILERWLPNAF